MLPEPTLPHLILYKDGDITDTRALLFLVHVQVKQPRYLQRRESCWLYWDSSYHGLVLFWMFNNVMGRKRVLACALCFRFLKNVILRPSISHIFILHRANLTCYIAKQCSNFFAVSTIFSNSRHACEVKATPLKVAQQTLCIIAQGGEFKLIFSRSTPEKLDFPSAKKINPVEKVVWRPLNAIWSSSFHLCDAHMLNLSEVLQFFSSAPDRALIWFTERLEAIVLGMDCDGERDHPQLVSTYERQRRDLQAFILARLVELAKAGLYRDAAIMQPKQESPVSVDDQLEHI